MTIILKILIWSKGCYNKCMKQYVFIFSLFLSVISFSQQIEYVDFKKANAMLGVRSDSSKIGGKVWYTLDVIKDTDSIFIDAKNMEINNVAIRIGNANTINLDYRNDGERLWLKYNFKKDNTYRVYFDYSAMPKKALYFVSKNSDSINQIWTQGQGKYTSNWLPSFDDMNEKVEFDLSITFQNDYEVIANGKLKNKESSGDFTTWHYDMQKPMSSYLVALAIGKYEKKIEYSKRGISLEMYYYPEDSLKVKPTYRYTKRMFDFLEDEIGVSYPWQNYKQVPVHDFLYSGMENTSLTIFSDAFMIDETAFVDKNYVNVNAHELAHQWFGNLVTAKSSEHHWLQEGFATYYALLAERDIFGEDYYYWKLYESAQQLLQQDKSGQGTSLLNPKSSSLTFYQRGAWALHVLLEKVGDKVFKEAVKNYLQKHQFKNVETNDFISEVEKASGEDLTNFVSLWLTDKAFPFNEAMESLKQNSVFIQEYLMVDCTLKNARCDYYLTSGVSDEAKSKIIAQVPERITSDTFKSSIKVRQAIAKNVTKIPLKLKTDYESLLNDKSYKTIEMALYNLWVNFPKEKSKYLDQTKSVIGFNDKNVRQLWLVLALSTPDYNDTEKQSYFEELVSYTASNYSFEVRQLAFTYLNSLGVFDEVSLSNLKEASKHHNWRFKKFAKNLIEELSDNETYQKILKPE